MRELKGDWRDLFNGFMVALDLRKMFLAFAGLVFTVTVGGALTFWAAVMTGAGEAVRVPSSLAPDAIWNFFSSCWHFIYTGGVYDPGVSAVEAKWYIYVPYSIAFLVAMFAIWGYFGGAIARIAAYEIAKDGERIETGRAMRFAGRKFWSFFFAPVICILGFLFFAFCVWFVALIGKFADFLYIGGPLLALFLPLAVLAGFIMMLIVVGSLAGFPLFTPAVAAEGTDSFDAVSRGFSYVYSRPWHFAGYQITAAVYGIACFAFVFLFTVGMVHLALETGGAGFDLVQGADSEEIAKETDPAKQRMMRDMDKERFHHVANAAWAHLLTPMPARGYSWTPEGLVRTPHPYGRIMYLANRIAAPSYAEGRITQMRDDRLHGVMFWIVFAWMIIVLGHAYGYAVSYVISQQTMIYYILRKKVDGIEMNEVFEEAEEEEPLPEPGGAAEKPEEAKKEEPAKDTKRRRTSRRTSRKRAKEEGQE